MLLLGNKKARQTGGLGECETRVRLTQPARLFPKPNENRKLKRKKHTSAC